MIVGSWSRPVLLCALLFVPVASQADAEWQLVRTESAHSPPYSLHRRSISSGVVEWKADAVVQLPASELAQAALHNLIDPASSTFERTLLRREPAAIVLYQYIRLPIVSDRDVITRTTYGVDREGVYFLRWWNTEEPGRPPVDGVVRLPHVEGSLALVPIADGQTRVSERSSVALGGLIPAWLVDGRMGNTLIEDLTLMRITASSGRYEAVEFPLTGRSEAAP